MLLDALDFMSHVRSRMAPFACGMRVSDQMSQPVLLKPRSQDAEVYGTLLLSICLILIYDPCFICCMAQGIGAGKGRCARFGLTRHVVGRVASLAIGRILVRLLVRLPGQPNGRGGYV